LELVQVTDLGHYLKRVREDSVAIVGRMKIPLSQSVPLLPDEFALKSSDQITNRALGTLVTVSVAYGWSRPDAIAWIESEGLDCELSDSESRFVHKGQGVVPVFMTHVESLNALLWSLNIVESLDCRKDCPDDLVRRVPNVKEMESSRSFRSSVCVRPTLELLKCCDLYTCVFHTLSEAFLEQRRYPRKVEPHRVFQRLRALRWLLFDLNWDEARPDWHMASAK
jgi:hypothetical protein